ncbi:hypothetical protein B0H10DRAFT_2437001 [Mycena sp. CBHHK59/15]|nr:hypothetical protein B0H10DRAFT_2437001 [Mycena sp. CBHHK59/15]
MPTFQLVIEFYKDLIHGRATDKSQAPKVHKRRGHIQMLSDGTPKIKSNKPSTNKPQTNKPQTSGR